MTGSFNTIIGQPGENTLVGTGNDYIIGLGNASTLIGGPGTDILDPGGDFSTLIGGPGTNTFVIYNIDVVVEGANSGGQRVLTYSSYDMGTADYNGDGTIDSANVQDIRLVSQHIWDDTADGAFTGKFLVTTGATITGNALDNTIEGDDGGGNTLVGGAGNDTFIVHGLPGTALADVIVENLGGGNDTIMYTPGVAGQTYDLSLIPNVENLTFGGKNAIIGLGTSGDNTLTSNTGIDTLEGGLGNDTYVLNNVSTKIIEAAGGGTDTVSCGFSYSIATQPTLENITLTGTANVTATGNGGVNTLVGNDGNNILDGVLNTGASAGLADTYFGSLGNDTYMVHNSNDVVLADSNTLHSADGGTNVVMSPVSFDLGTQAVNVQGLTLTGTANINATGNALDNTLVGNAGVNILDALNSNGAILKGGAGNDTLYAGSGTETLDGGTGADTMYNGNGTEQFIVDNANDLILLGPNGASGFHGIQSSVTFNMATQASNLTGERELTLEGTQAINGYGNDLGDSLVGNTGTNTIIGGTGNDTIVGGGGLDKLFGGDGNDTITGGSSVDTIHGGNGDDTLYSGGNNDTMYGDAGNDVLDGGPGAATMYGGTGNDTYMVDNSAAKIFENSGEGTDTVIASINFSLQTLPNVENLTLKGGSVGIGNDGVNVITGYAGAKTLEGLGGDDTMFSGNATNVTIDGGAGNDTMTGGTGNDTFIVDSALDVVTAGNGGTDAIVSSVNWDMSSTGNNNSDIKNLTLTGSVATVGGGNALDNVITANNAVDTLTGGAGNDTYVVNNSSDTIVEAFGGGTDTVISSVNFTLPSFDTTAHTGSEVENLTLTGSANLIGIGNDLNNVLTANGGSDTLEGGLGNDTYVLGTPGANIVTTIAVDTGGIDTVMAGFSYDISSRLDLENITLTGTGNFTATGNTDVNVLTGNSGNNVLDAGLNTGTFSGQGDTYIGSAGNDTYMINQSNDTVKGLDAGTDLCIAKVNYDMSTYATSVDNLTLTGVSATVGVGNALDNIITGNNLNDTLTGGAGNDTFHAGGTTGIDTFIGGTGNDTYFVDNSSDFISENGAEGIDVVMASVNYDMSTLALNVEVLTLTGSALVGIGNASDNTITGNAGNDTLDGGGGNDTITSGAGLDTLIGGDGNDTFIISNASDVIIENTTGASSSADLIKCSFSYALPDSSQPNNQIENLTLTGTGNYNGTGNALNNIITGNSGNNTLDGGVGADTMIGGGGTDTYMVDNTGDVIFGTGTAVVNTNSGSVATYDMSVNGTLANIVLITGANSISLTGNAGNDTITTNAAVDTINGGAGNDTIYMHNASDVVLDTDTPKVTVDLISIDTANIGGATAYHMDTQAANVLALTVTGTGNFDIYANNAGDTITGNSGLNHFFGGTGNDTFYADANDTLVGGGGSDTAAVGFSVVLGSQTRWTGIENILLTGTSALNATGDAHANTITGNSGNNILNDGGVNIDDVTVGSGPADTMIGGAGNDTYYVNNSNDVVDETSNGGAGVDWIYTTVDYTMGNGVDNMAVLGTVAGSYTGGQGRYLVGNGGANIIDGTTGNDTIDGGGGVDTMNGGLGNDTYFVDANDTIIDSGGIDTVVSEQPSYTLPTGMENLIMGPHALNGVGNSVVNTLWANNAGDTLDGGAGADTMFGGAGNDTFIVDNAHDIVHETSTLTTSNEDVIMSKISIALSAAVAAGASGTYGSDATNFHTFNFSGFTTSTDADSGVENLTLTGTALIGIGNNLNDTITGNAGNNTLVAGSGNDFLDGGLGSDTYIGGSGQDTFVIGADATSHHDTIYNFNPTDVLDFTANIPGFDPTKNVLDDFVAYRWDGHNTIVYVDKDGVTGSQYGFQEVAVVVGFDLAT